MDQAATIALLQKLRSGGTRRAWTQNPDLCLDLAEIPNLHKTFWLCWVGGMARLCVSVAFTDGASISFVPCGGFAIVLDNLPFAWLLLLP